ncbi:MAG: hypothetical protein AAFX01_05165 [Cyanobacteria bacterium J06638_28]
MPYSKFTSLSQVEAAFDLSLEEPLVLFQNEIPVIYDAVTTGILWKFLRLIYPIAAIDLDEYYVKEVSKILGILSLPFLSECNNQSHVANLTDPRLGH